MTLVDRILITAVAAVAASIALAVSALGQPYPLNPTPEPDIGPVSFSQVFGVQAETNCAQKAWNMTDYLNLPGNFSSFIANAPIENQCGEPMMVVDSLFETKSECVSSNRAHIAAANPSRGQNIQPFTFCDSGIPQECGFPVREEGSTCCAGLPTQEVPWQHDHCSELYGPIYQQIAAGVIKFPLKVGGIGGNPLLLYPEGRSSPIGYGSFNCLQGAPTTYDMNLTPLGVDSTIGYSNFENRWIGVIVAELDGADITPLRKHHQVTITNTWNAEFDDAARGLGPGGNNAGNYFMHAIFSDGGAAAWVVPPLVADSFFHPNSCQKKRYELGLPAIEGESRHIVGLGLSARPERVGIAWFDVGLYPDFDSDGIDSFWDCDLDNNGDELGQICDSVDRALIVAAQGTTGTCGLLTDLTADCNVDNDDLVRFDALASRTDKVPVPTFLPEPGTGGGLLAGLGLLAILRRKSC